MIICKASNDDTDYDICRTVAFETEKCGVALL